MLGDFTKRVRGRCGAGGFWVKSGGREARARTSLLLWEASGSTTTVWGGVGPALKRWRGRPSAAGSRLAPDRGRLGIRAGAHPEEIRARAAHSPIRITMVVTAISFRAGMRPSRSGLKALSPRRHILGTEGVPRARWFNCEGPMTRDIGRRGEVAQLAEHATENRGVGSSILPLATKEPNFLLLGVHLHPLRSSSKRPSRARPLSLPAATRAELLRRVDRVVNARVI